MPIKDYQQETVWALRGKTSQALRLYTKIILFRNLFGRKELQLKVALGSYNHEKVALALFIEYSARALPKFRLFSTRNKSRA